MIYWVTFLGISESLDDMGTVSKALTLLDYFTVERPEIGLSELSRLSGLNKTTVYRMMTELQECRFVEQVNNDRTYRIGTAVLRLSALRDLVVPLRENARRTVQGLADKTGETAHFSILDGAELSTLSYAYSTDHGTRVMMDDAAILPIHATSSGLAVLAFSGDDFVDLILSKPLKVRTPFTVVDPWRLRQMIDRTRELGVAEYVSGFESDVHSFAAPIFDMSRRVIGALAVAAPVNRVNPSNAPFLRQSVFDAAQTLTTMTGGFMPSDFPEIQTKVAT